MEGLGLPERTAGLDPKEPELGAEGFSQELPELAGAGALQELLLAGVAERPVWRAGVEDLR